MFADLLSPVHSLASELPYLWELNDNTIRNRDNSLLACFEVRGPDGLTTDFETMELLRTSLAELLNDLDDHWTIYAHRLMRPTDTRCQPHKTEGFAADIDKAWNAAARDEGQQEFVVILSILRRTKTPLGVPFFSKAAKAVLKEDTEDKLSDLNQLAALFAESLPVDLHRLNITDGSFLGFLQSITTGIFVPEYRSLGRLISEDICNTDVLLGTDGVITYGADKAYGAVLWVKKYPSETEPGFLDGLDARPGVSICHSYTPADRDTMSTKADMRIRQMIKNDDAAKTVIEDLRMTANEIESFGLGFGEHHFTVTVIADTREELEQRVQELIGAARKAKVIMIHDRSALPTTFFAQHPGNTAKQSRSGIVSTLEFANFASQHTMDSGITSERLPWKTPVSILQNAKGTIHRFSFHPAGDPNKEPTNGHTLILGPPHSGKTTTALFLASQALRTGGRLIAFDKDRAMQMAITALGGQYAAIQAGKNTGLNPLLTERGDRGEAWLDQWLSALLESTGDRLTPRQSEVLKNALRQNGEAPDAGRNFASFQSLIGDAGDNRELALRIAEWGPDGRYNWTFGKADQPVIDLNENPVSAIDLTEIMKSGIERTAILGYLFRAIEVLIEDKVPTVLMIDEAWQALDDEYFAGMLLDWLASVRKKNVVVVMMTQFPSQIRKSKAGQTILEGLPNKLLFPNHAATADDYDGYDLSIQQLGFLIGTALNNRTALWKHSEGSGLLNVDLSCLGPMLTALGGGESGLRRFGPDYANTPNFWRT